MPRNRPMASMLLALVVCGAGASRAGEDCAAGETAGWAPAWQRFRAVVQEHYLQPRELAANELPLRTLAEILGHALARQARQAGTDAARREAFACVEAAIERELGSLERGVGDLVGDPGPAPGEGLARRLRDAEIGFYDEEVLALTGVTAGQSLPSIYGDVPRGAGPVGEVQAVAAREPEPGERCRVHLHPELFTALHDDWEWYLLREPLKRGGYYYDTVRADPQWPADHAKRPENRLREGQIVLLTGRKGEVRERIARIRQACGN